MNVGEWQKRLEITFGIDGIVGRRLLDILDAERIYGAHIAETYHGHLVLINSFLDFYIETFQMAMQWINQNGWSKLPPMYSYATLCNAVTFRSFRAADTLFMNGYPYDGYSLLRDIKDRAIFLAAVIHKITSFLLLEGLADETVAPNNMKIIIANRRKEETRVHDLMIGKKSGLPHRIVQDLERWEQLFNQEVHGSRFTMAEIAMNWKEGNAPLHLGPIYDKSGMAMYMNRASEICWMLTRTLPFIQPAEDAFGKNWKSKHRILDDSFEHMLKSLEKMGKQIASSFTYFVKNKFAFDENLSYSE